MSQLISYVSLSVVPFSYNSTHRYYNIENHYTSMCDFSNCRFIKQNIIALNTNYDVLRNLNFGYYQNFTNGKKFYFFITDVEYINDNTSYIYIRDDYFSTYSNEVFSSLKKSLVIRQHPADSTYPRTVEYSPILPTVDTFVDSKELTWSDDVIVAVNRYIPQFTDISDSSVNEMFFTEFLTAGVGKHAGDITYRYIKTKLSNAITMIKNAVAWGYQDCVLGVYNVPQQFVSASSTNNETLKFGGIKSKNSENGTTFLARQIPDEEWQFLNYTNGMIPMFDTAFSVSKDSINTIYSATYPKCYDSQYISVIVKLVDNVTQYDYMLFSNDILFNIYCTLNENATLYIVPYGFDGVAGDNWDGGYISSGLAGKCVINTDNQTQAFNNAIKDFNIKSLSQITDMISNVIPNNPFTKNTKNQGSLQLDDFISNIMSNTLSEVTAYNENRKTSTKMVGAGNTNVYQYTDTNIHIGFRHLQNEDFKRLDKFFSTYGYLYNTLMLPTIRDTYSYLQGDVNFSTPIPTQAYNFIKNLFATGVTVWNNTTMYEYDV